MKSKLPTSNHKIASKDKKRAREARKAAKTAKDGEDDKDDDESDGEPQMSETNGNTCFLKGSSRFAVRLRI